jgi:hypothetical protein
MDWHHTLDIALFYHSCFGIASFNIVDKGFAKMEILDFQLIVTSRLFPTILLAHNDRHDVRSLGTRSLSFLKNRCENPPICRSWVVRKGGFLNTYFFRLTGWIPHIHIGVNSLLFARRAPYKYKVPSTQYT